MFSGWKLLAAASVAAIVVAGCIHEDHRQHELGGTDVKAASDKMAADLLALPALNADAHQWTIVVGKMEDQTAERGFSPANYDIFLERLKVNLSMLSHGRVTLIQNKASFHNLRNKELEGPNERDDFGQTGGPTAQAAPPASIQPDYELDGVAMNLPNRASNYYQLEFQLNNLRTREIPWTRDYEVEFPR